MKTDKATMQSHGIIPSKPDEQGTPVNGGTYGHSKTGKSKLKSGRPKGGINQGGIAKPKS